MTWKNFPAAAACTAAASMSASNHNHDYSCQQQQPGTIIEPYIMHFELYCHQKLNTG
jgi:hypothetical protein